ncbi:copper resistance CopC family protein [Acrocarpospora catenulata]|uniref:copper resistance CopC family protein n=1 Tax=Acrocarpospora catenulata TaxID=2836182 RepID=UPI001BDA91F4|nr:copper resistance protein CopC [Acrocarpospora catenulata]
MKRTPVVVALVILAFLLSGTAPALAHTSLRSSHPARGAEVDGLRKVTLEFTESVRFPVVIVTGPDGLRYENGKPRVEGPKVLQDLGPQLPAGAYTVAFRVVARDGHPLEGEIPFRVTPPPAATPAVSPVAAEPAPDPTPEATPEAPATSAAPEAPGAPSVPEARPSPASASEGGQVPPWVWVVVFGIAGIGIGMAFSLRKKP